MGDIHYTIKFYAYWHCGSGLSAGADVDELVVKDRNGLPFVPGKTLKGLVREAVGEYVFFSGQADALMESVQSLFGSHDQTEGIAHFGNATLSRTEREAIVAAQAQSYLYDKLTTTAIDTDGVACDHSLRSMEVTVPCTLYGTITGVPDTMRPIVIKCLGFVKNIGMKRNRGLGRCDISEGGEV